MNKRSQQKLITKEATVFKFMRLSRGISQAKAAQECGISVAAIGHYENGRMEISEDREERFLEIYRFTSKEYKEYLQGKPVPILDPKQECISLIEKLQAPQVGALAAFLQSLVHQ